MVTSPNYSTPSQLGWLNSNYHRSIARIRLDAELLRREIIKELDDAVDLVVSKRIKVNGSFAAKITHLGLPSDSIELANPPKKYVSRGGEKLQHALQIFGLSPAGKQCLDVGASTGGFTDCLLQNEAKQVTCIDVGYGLLHERINTDPRVISLERTNIRDTRMIFEGTLFEFVVADLSFISLKTVMSELLDLALPTAPIVLLVKPQFEATKEEANKAKGVIDDPDIWLRALEGVTKTAVDLGGSFQSVGVSPILGRAGNKEFFLHLAKTGESKAVDFTQVIKRDIDDHGV